MTDSKMSLRDRRLGYLALRWCLGVNIATHGLARLLAGTSSFASALEKQFASTFLSGWSVHLFGLTLPWLELAIGLALLAGVATRYSLAAGALLMVVLTFGTCLTQQWEVAGTQLVYAAVFALLISTLRFNYFAMDSLLAAARAKRSVAVRRVTQNETTLQDM